MSELIRVRVTTEGMLLGRTPTVGDAPSLDSNNLDAWWSVANAIVTSVETLPAPISEREALDEIAATLVEPGRNQPIQADWLRDIIARTKAPAPPRDEAADLAFTVRALQIGISKTTNERDAAYEVLREIDRQVRYAFDHGGFPVGIRELLLAKVPGIHAAQT